MAMGGAIAYAVAFALALCLTTGLASAETPIANPPSDDYRYRPVDMSQGVLRYLGNPEKVYTHEISRKGNVYREDIGVRDFAVFTYIQLTDEVIPIDGRMALIFASAETEAAYGFAISPAEIETYPFAGGTFYYIAKATVPPGAAQTSVCFVARVVLGSGDRLVNVSGCVPGDIAARGAKFLPDFLNAIVLPDAPKTAPGRIPT